MQYWIREEIEQLAIDASDALYKVREAEKKSFLVAGPLRGELQNKSINF